MRAAVSTVFLGAFLVNSLHGHGPMWLTVVAALGTYAAGALLTGHLRRRAKRGRRAT